MKDYIHLFRKYPITQTLAKWDRCKLIEADIWLPPSTGVYIMARKKNTTIIYVGKSENLLKRFNDGHHQILAALREKVDVLFYRPMDVSSDELAVYEAEVINRLQPLLNTYHR
jgi:excinuclease UvrABC nuclease subunit